MIEIRRKGQQAATEAHRGAETPFTAQGVKQGGESSAQPVPALKRPLKPFTALDSSRNYRALYRAACDFHERHNPPTLDSLDLYRADVEADAARPAAQFGGDPFLVSMLHAIKAELNREAMHAAAQAFHERHSPPTAADRRGADYAQYWTIVADDMTATAARFDDDPHIQRLLVDRFEDLEREYAQLQGEAQP